MANSIGLGARLPAVAAGVLAALSAGGSWGASPSEGVSWQPGIEVASGGGYQGPWRMNESVYDYVDDPTVALGPEGDAAVAWVDQARKDVFLQLYAPAGNARLSEPANVSGTPEVFSWLPRVAFGPGEPPEIYVLWQEIIFSGGSHGGDILFARSTDGGRSFDEPINLSEDVAGSGKGRLSKEYWHNGSLDLAVGSDGVLFAAWTEYEGRLWVSRSEDGGASFAEPLHVAGTDAEPARGPSLAVGGQGEVYLAWTVGEDPSADIHLARSSDGGESFGAARVPFRTAAHADAPKIAADDRGGLHLVYGSSPGGPWRRYRILYARSGDGGESFQGPREISSPQAERLHSVNFPALDLDGEGSPFVLWERYPGSRPRARGLGYTWSADGGRGFADPAVVPGSLDPRLGVNGSLQGSLMSKLAVNRAGAVAVVNSRFREGEASAVRLFRGHLAGP